MNKRVVTVQLVILWKLWLHIYIYIQGEKERQEKLTRGLAFSIHNSYFCPVTINKNNGFFLTGLKIAGLCLSTILSAFCVVGYLQFVGEGTQTSRARRTVLPGQNGDFSPGGPKLFPKFP